MPLPPRIAHLDELESIPGPGSLTWHPVRFALGIRAFGCHAYTAHEARAAPLIRSDPERAREIIEDGLSLHPDGPTLHYNLACIEALAGDRDAALGSLRRAIELRPEAADWAREDEDLAPCAATRSSRR